MTEETEQHTGVRIETPEQLGFLVADWHRNIMHHLMSVVEAPEAISIKATLDGESDELLAGRERRAFQIGVEYALNQIAQLPFVPAMEEDDAQASDQNTGDGSEL